MWTCGHVAVHLVAGVGEVPGERHVIFRPGAIHRPRVHSQRQVAGNKARQVLQALNKHPPATPQLSISSAAASVLFSSTFIQKQRVTSCGHGHQVGPRLKWARQSIASSIRTKLSASRAHALHWLCPPAMFRAASRNMSSSLPCKTSRTALDVTPLHNSTNMVC